MYTLSSNMLKWSYYQKMSGGQHFEGVSHSMGYYSMHELHNCESEQCFTDTDPCRDKKIKINTKKVSY